MIGHINAIYAWEAFCIVAGLPSAAFLIGRYRRSRRKQIR